MISEGDPDGVTLLAAGRLRAALDEIAANLRTAHGVQVTTTYGPSGLLRERIEAGEHADVFASDELTPQDLLTGSLLARRPVKRFGTRRRSA